MYDIQALALRARVAATTLAETETAIKNAALNAMADAIDAARADILAANANDISAASAAGLSAQLIERLTLNDARIDGICAGVRRVASLPDPVGEEMERWQTETALDIQKIRVPFGVIGIIYEARPNVTADAAALCLKAGSAVILRGGKEAIRSNMAIVNAMRGGLEAVGQNPDAVLLVEDTSRETATAMMKLNGFIDVLIPRGGAGLIRTLVENATVPVIETGTGNCHVYVDAAADIEMAKNIIVNAKASRPSVCNAAETLLVHKDVAEQALPILAAALNEAGVALRGCDRARAIIPFPIAPADETDWATEFLDYILAVRVVDSLEEAIAHIRTYTTGHSECIVTADDAAAARFVSGIDAAVVYVNASTRFTDGGEFGYGAEIGISTQKLHARGPMGLAALTSVKYIVYGSGQIR